MKSISNLAEIGQRKLLVGHNGLQVKIRGISRGNHLDEIKRGSINEFSKGASRRLREALFRYSIPNAHTVGVTLTVPWHADDFEPLMDEWRSTFERFRTSFARALPNSAAIYRNEIQRRGAPHVHAVCYIAPSDVAKCVDIQGERGPARSRGPTQTSPRRVGWDESPQNVGAHSQPDQVYTFGLMRQALSALWVSAVGKNLHGGRLNHFLAHGVKVDNLEASTCGNLFRYLADHTSKHKLDQLGYKGKQWGFISRHNLTASDVEALPPFNSPRHEVIFYRMLRKVQRVTINHCIGSSFASNHPYKTAAHPEFWFTKGVWHNEPPFGCVHKGGRRRSGVIFLPGGGKTAERLFEASALISASDAERGVDRPA